MAIELEATYPGRTKVDANDPDGNFLDSSPPGSFTGTPFKQEWARDVWAFVEKIRLESGIVPSGAPDEAVTSQRYAALLKIARDIWPLWDAAHIYGKGFMVVASDDKVYQSLQASNVGHDPVSNPTWWKAFEPVDIIDNLLSTDPAKALSANQGNVLKGLIDNPADATWTIKGVSLLPKRIIISNGGASQIFFQTGVMEFDDGSGRAPTQAYNKDLGALWSPGNAGGLDTGSASPNTWYATYAIYNPTTETADYLFTATLGGPTLPSGYTKKEYLGMIRNGATNIDLFWQFGKWFFWDTPVYDIGITSGSAPTTRSLYTMTVPPGLKIKGLFDIMIFGSAASPGALAIIFTDPDALDILPVFSTAFSLMLLKSSGYNGANGGQFQIMTNTSSQIGLRATSQFMQIDGISKGWEDLNLRN